MASSLKFMAINIALETLTEDERFEVIKKCYLLMDDNNRQVVEKWIKSPFMLQNTLVHKRDWCDRGQCHNEDIYIFEIHISKFNHIKQESLLVYWCESCILKVINIADNLKCPDCFVKSYTKNFKIYICKMHNSKFGY